MPIEIAGLYTILFLFDWVHLPIALCLPRSLVQPFPVHQVYILLDHPTNNKIISKPQTNAKNDVNRIEGVKGSKLKFSRSRRLKIAVKLFPKIFACMHIQAEFFYEWMNFEMYLIQYRNPRYKILQRSTREFEERSRRNNKVSPLKFLRSGFRLRLRFP